ncbi:MAG: TDP-N-acetylfucosamine:lipid II N-acetylfucosaminyltransferase [Bacteroidales bacterium]|nr:TDP-N-acetylfucosamine:lipid II N-acetylfucosaminyltransferase [Bacteroidales bacterium]
MNLHIAPDDKFLDFFIENEEKYTRTKNRYIVYSSFETLKYSKNSKIEKIGTHLDEITEKIKDINLYESLYIHYLSNLTIDLLNTLDIKIPIVWIFWGADGFSPNRKYSEKTIILPKTKSFYRKYLKNKMIWCKNPEFLYKNYKRYKEKEKQIKSAENKYIQAARKVNYFAHYISEDYEIVKNHTGFNAQFIDFNYISIEQSLNDKIENNINTNNENNVIIGNSEAFTNNHIDVFDLLARHDLSNIDKIYCPLSYGHSDRYKKIVIDYGYQKFSDKFIPLTDFMPLNEYYDLLSNIKIAIYGIVRSQAAGNILTLLLNGTTVLMPQKNTLYKLLKNVGTNIYSLENDLANILKDLKYANVESERKQKNKEKLVLLFGEEKIKEKYNNLLKLK